VVTDLNQKYSLHYEIVKKTDFSLLKRISLPQFPAVEIDGDVVFQGQDVSLEQLENAIRSKGAL